MSSSSTSHQQHPTTASTSSSYNSFFSRLSQDASNFCQDAYGNLILGDDAGKSARLVLVLKPKLGERIPLGMTFIEINGRAYVKSVLPDSPAQRAGVLPRDAIQFASLYDADFLEEHDEHDDDDDDENDQVLEESATSYALACEARGMRITYDELRQLLAEGLDPMQSAFLSPPTTSEPTAFHQYWSTTTSSPIPSTINICAPPHSSSSSQENGGLSRPLSPFCVETPKPVVFVLRRTRQRSSASTCYNFRMDDECDFAASLIRKLAPTSDMELPLPDAWDELFHDGTDWLLGRAESSQPQVPSSSTTTSTTSPTTTRKEEESGIPLDDYERQRAIKIASLRSRMAAEAMSPTFRNDNVEAATIRGMIQKAVGLAFVRASKVVLGVSFHGGSGIVIARLSDGTWSAPSAIGTWGLGFGIQFGLEVAEYIFILQTQESLDHFRKGSSFNIGGNVGAAVAGMGREAYGAASVGNTCTRPPQQQVKEDEYNDDEDSEDGNAKDSSAFGVAPIVAYAKSQGLYVGVSLEGSRIFTRSDVNARAYKFATGREVTAKDILSGKVATPPEAEDLYAALHSVEFTHEMSCLPRPPEILRKDSANPWQYNRSTLGQGGNGYISASTRDPFPFLKELSREEEEECDSFETQFKKFMYGGVSVQRLLPNSESASSKTRKERRTLWLMLPEVGALRLGFVSKLSDGEGAVSNKSSTQRVKRDTGDSSLLGWEGDLATVASEEITLDSVFMEKDTPSGLRAADVQLSNKHSLALTDVTLLSQQSNVPIDFTSDDKTEHLRIISIQDVSGTSLLFLANNFREAELLVCGLKLLLERETARLGVRGGLPISALGGKSAECAMSPAAARGFKEIGSSDKSLRGSRRSNGYASSEMGDESTIGSFSTANFNSIPEGRKKWGNVPGRDYMREKAAAAAPTNVADMRGDYESTERSDTKYVHGQLIVRDIATNIHLPLPLPLCRVLLLDSTSPVIEQWEDNRGDKNYSRTNWTFPPATPRELERHASEHQLIASGSMMGAHRTTSFDRMRNGSLVHLSETQIVDADDSEKLAFTISERMPRRGFSMKVKFVLRSSKDNSCEATVIGEVRPVGKNMSNQAAVHKAFLLVLNELKMRYGSEGKGLMASFLDVVSSLPNPESAVAAVGRNGRKSSRGRAGRSGVSSPFRKTAPGRSPSADSSAAGSSKPRKPRPESGLVSFDDIMNASHDMPPPKEPVRSRKEERPARPATPSLQQIAESDPNLKKMSKAEKEKKYLENNEFADLPIDEQEDFLKNSQPKTIEVKPLPKIRLSLMPAPREEDEENDSDKSPGAKKKSKKKSRRNMGQPSSSRKSSRR